MTTRAKRTRGVQRRTTTPARTSSSRTPLIVGAGILAIVIVAAVIALTITGGDTAAEPAPDPVAVSGDALAALPASGADPAIGQAIPTLTGTDAGGQPITIGPDDGPMTIVILAHWCPHCQAEVPRLVDYLQTTGMPDGVRLVGLSTSINRAQPNYPPSAWLEREGWTAPTMTDDANNGALRALGIGNFPGFVFVDADGRVAGRLTGEIGIETFEQAVNTLAP